MREKFRTHAGSPLAAAVALVSLLGLGACGGSGTSGRADAGIPADGSLQDASGADGSDHVSDIASGDFAGDSGNDAAVDALQVDAPDERPTPDGTDQNDTAGLDADVVLDVAEVVPDVPIPHSTRSSNSLARGRPPPAERGECPE